MLFGYTPFIKQPAGIFVCALKSTVDYFTNIWVRLFSAKNFRLSRCHFEFIILRYRNIIA
jgi:hypothetical protein